VSKKTENVVIAGLGGQGVLRASDILADAAFRAGYDVKKSEVHGMSQRGGSVASDVRFGEQVYSPMIPRGQADYLVVLAADQVDINRPLLRHEGVLITPQWINENRLDSRKSLNVALLGALSTYLDIPEEEWFLAIRAAFPERLHEANLSAFELGRSSAQPVRLANEEQ
jgi:indolepyruvate ferredoxin oxidoreductase beta subunit